MSNEITMPKLSDTMEEGKILRWLKHPGDAIKRGEAIAEVETDKADMVLEAFDEGVLEIIKLNEGESAPVGAVIAMLKAPGAGASASNAKAQPKSEARQEAAGSDMKSDSKPPQKPMQKANAKSGGKSEGKQSEQMQTERQPEQQQNGQQRSVPDTDDLEKVVENSPDVRDSAKSAPEPAEVRKLQAVRKPIAASAVVSDGGEDAKQVHPAMSAHQSAAPTAIAAPPPHHEEEEEPHHDDDAEIGPDGHKLRASPLARRAAEEAGIDISHVRGTGPDGRVTKRDVDNFLREQQLFKFRRLVSPREGAPGSREELSSMRKTIAKRMALSKREIPHFYVTVEVDMEDAVRLKSSLEATELFEETVTYNDLIVKACALALGRYPRINASFQDEGILIHPNVNIGVAVAIEDGLILPVIHGCEQMTLLEISRAAHRLVSKASRGGFTSEELSGATFSISNMGMLGIEHFSAVIVPPQAAILAVSAIKERPVVRNSQLAVGKTMMITGSFDHRIVDGVVAGRFLQELKRFLENPASLLV